MAKEDFCFTYYDGDAARDKAHMTRLERGAYDDLISAQRKRGHLSIDDIKRVLSKDFDECWSSLEWILKKDDEGKYFIEWVDLSIQKMRKHSENQKNRIKKYWDGKKNDPGYSNNIPRNNHGIEMEEPLEDGNENGNEDEIGNEEKGSGEKTESWLWDVEKEKFMQDGKWIFKFCSDKNLQANTFDHLAREFLSDLELKEDYKPIKEIRSHFTNWFNKKQNGTHSKTSGNKSKPVIRDIPKRGFGQL